MLMHAAGRRRADRGAGRAANVSVITNARCRVLSVSVSVTVARAVLLVSLCGLAAATRQAWPVIPHKSCWGHTLNQENYNYEKGRHTAIGMCLGSDTCTGLHDVGCLGHTFRLCDVDFALENFTNAGGAGPAHCVHRRPKQLPRSVCDDDAAQLKDTYGSWAECAAFSVEELEAGFCAESTQEPWCNRTCGLCSLTVPMEYPRAGVEADSWVREMWRRAEAGRPSHKRVLNLLVESEFFADFLKVRVAVSTVEELNGALKAALGVAKDAVLEVLVFDKEVMQERRVLELDDFKKSGHKCRVKLYQQPSA